nr:universal stress protein PHOS34 [Ipomoea batatas]GMD51382.1 universal stress protein PHOS34 [Ipomoea batatas]GMD58031.1 universal stress protein PHOS34 [Ipomoea batatas]
MQQNQANSSVDSDLPRLANIKVRASSPRFPPPTTPSSTETPTAGAQRRIGIAVDLSDESAFAVKWAVHQYLRPGDAVILVHVRPTSVLYGADWGSVDLSIVDTDNEESQQKLEDDFDTFTITKASDLAQPLVDAQIPFKIHIVKDHDMKERLCLEVERYPDEKDAGNANAEPVISVASVAEEEDEPEYHDAHDDRKAHPHLPIDF